MLGLGTYTDPIILDNDDEDILMVEENENVPMIYLEQDEAEFWELLNKLPAEIQKKIALDFFPRELLPDDCLFLIKFHYGAATFYGQTMLISSRNVGAECQGLLELELELQLYPASVIPHGPWKEELDNNPAAECYKCDPDIAGDLEANFLTLSRDLDVTKRMGNFLGLIPLHPRVFPGFHMRHIVRNSPSGLQTNFHPSTYELISLERFVDDEDIFDVDDNE